PPDPARPEAEPPSGPSDEEHPAGEISMEQPASAGPPNTEEREAIAAQPTELHDLQGDLNDDEFFDAKSLSDELDQALEEPASAEDAVPAEEPPPAEEPGPVDEIAPVEPDQTDEAEDEQPDEPDPSEQADGSDVAAEPEAAPAADPRGDPEPSSAFFDQESEDVLEETPEFLQDTPENERLWFEQKPPKDFDFDD
ncbi:MAG TPA: hypothetical protein VKA89_09015, partial [Solirubrobacterales bacterium]|nr:hypothetical protein [Solirubrobacterales bacterium]